MLSQSDVRDKMGRLVQYAFRMLSGVLAEMPHDAARLELAATLTKLMATIGDARRCFRWLKGFSPLLALCDGSMTRGEVRAIRSSSEGAQQTHLRTPHESCVVTLCAYASAPLSAHRPHDR